MSEHELVDDKDPAEVYAEALEWATQRFGSKSKMLALGKWPTSNAYKKVQVPLMHLGTLEVGRRRYSDRLVLAWMEGLNKLSLVAQNRAMGLDDDDDS